VSNIGWFGETVAVSQHLNISRMRALELQRPMLRATNTGATVVIDHGGRVTHALPPHTQGVLDGTVQGRTGITPFAWWAARLGLWLPTLIATAVVLVAARRSRAARQPD
jgi:apolipoprotein N-acyltransferase